MTPEFIELATDGVLRRMVELYEHDLKNGRVDQTPENIIKNIDYIKKVLILRGLKNVG